MLTRIVCLKEGRLEDSPTCSTAPLIEEGLHGISLTHAFGLPLLWAMRASEKTLICRTRRVPRAYLSGMWPARVGLSSPELLASSWGHICYTTAKGRPFFLIKESNFTTQNGLGLLPQIQWMTRKAGFPILKCCLSQKISNKGSPSLKIHISSTAQKINCLDYPSLPLSSPCLEWQSSCPVV